MAEIDREKVIEILSRHKTMTFGDLLHDGIKFDLGDVVTLLKEQEEQKRKWLQNIADNQLSIGGVDPLTEYEQGKWDGLAMAFEILTEER